jgi:hypothetical protein
VPCARLLGFFGVRRFGAFRLIEFTAFRFTAFRLRPVLAFAVRVLGLGFGLGLGFVSPFKDEPFLVLGGIGFDSMIVYLYILHGGFI